LNNPQLDCCRLSAAHSGGGFISAAEANREQAGSQLDEAAGELF
jgi:hypothetical protein